MLVSNHTLVKIASIGGILTVSMGLLYRNKLNREICATDYYKEAMKTLRSNRGAVYILGEPIKDYSVDVGKEGKNYTKTLSAMYEVPVKGTKERGTLYFWANRKSTEDGWTVSRIELGLKSEPNKRLLVKSGDK